MPEFWNVIFIYILILIIAIVLYAITIFLCGNWLTTAKTRRDRENRLSNQKWIGRPLDYTKRMK